MEELDYQKNGIQFKAFEKQDRRGINFFDWNLVTGEAALLIQQLPKDEYSALRTKLFEDMSAFLAVDGFDPVSLGLVIKNLEKILGTMRNPFLAPPRKEPRIHLLTMQV